MTNILNVPPSLCISGFPPFPSTTQPSVLLGEDPPPYSPLTSPESGSAPVISCRVCQSLISVEGKLHQHVVKCGVCNEATVANLFSVYLPACLFRLRLKCSMCSALLLTRALCIPYIYPCVHLGCVPKWYSDNDFFLFGLFPLFLPLSSYSSSSSHSSSCVSLSPSVAHQECTSREEVCTLPL